jgi:hypothetical protein
MAGVAAHAAASALVLAAADAAARRVVVGAYKRADTRWCFVHAVANLVVAACTLRFVLRADTLDEPEARFPITLAVALHAYHALRYELSRADWIHHAVFVPTIAVPGLLYDWRNLGNAQLFFMCGLPGAVLYAVVVARRASPAARRALPEARISAAVNVGVRAPGVLLSCARLLRAHRAGALPGVPTPFVLLQLALAPANALYYAHEAVARARRA